MSDFGELKKISLRQLWKHEATDFTPWLADNIERLGKTLGFDLELVEEEAPVGNFSLDILAKDLGSQKTVIIENQLAQTDHGHLGQLVTYASGLDASIIIWIAEFVREEHRQAMEWLNQRTDAETQFFAVVVEGLKIDESRPAPNFKPIVFPNEWVKSQVSRASGKIVSPRMQNLQDYFQTLIDELRETHRFTNAKKAQPDNWHAFTSGFSGVNYYARLTRDAVSVEVYIDMGEKEQNKRVFDALEEQKTEIEECYGDLFKWLKLDDKRASLVRFSRQGKIDLSKMSETEKQELAQWHIDNLLKMKKVFTPYLETHH